jgi:MinD-like ATPase involved in chromosome partitioning or flagellar assembly
MSEVIVFTSGKGGVGKSNLCLNTALQLTALQYRTCLFDGDLGLANVNILLGLDQEYTLDDVVFNNKSVEDVLVQTGYGFDIIPGSSGVEQIANLSAEQLESLISGLQALDAYDYFLIDTASGISRSVISFCMAARQTIIVITREATSLTDAYALLKILSVNKYKGSVRVLVNNCESIPQAKSTYLRYKKVVDKHLEIAIAPAGIILHDEHFERAVVQQKPLLELYPESIGSQCIKAFVANLVGEKGPEREDEGLARFWQRYLEQISAAASSDRPQKERFDGAGKGEAVPASDQPEPKVIPFSASGPVVQGFSQSLFSSAACLSGTASCPELLAAVLKRFNQGSLSTRELRHIIASDPVLMLQALNLLALSQLAPQGHISNLDELIDTLADEDIGPLLLQAAYRSASLEAGAGARDLQQWLRSYRCAVLARELALAVSFAFPDEAYLAALMLDIASGAVADADDTGTSIDHAGAGADLLHNAGLSTMICDAVRFHHYPAAQIGTAFKLVRIVYGAHALVHQSEVEEGIDLFDDIIELPEDQVRQLVDKAIEVTARTASCLDMNIAETERHGSGKGNGSLSIYLLDNLLTRAMMPPLSPSASLHDWSKMVQRSCKLLAGPGSIVSFVAEPDGKKLRVAGSSTNGHEAELESIVISVDNSGSLLSKAFTSGSAQTGSLADDSSLTLGDRQLGRLLGGETLICVPLRAGGRSVGVIACSTSDDGDAVERQIGLLLTVGARAAEDLAENV